MAQEGMVVKCMLTVQYKSLTLIKYGHVGRRLTTTPFSRKRYGALIRTKKRQKWNRVKYLETKDILQ